MLHLPGFALPVLDHITVALQRLPRLENRVRVLITWKGIFGGPS